MPTLPWTTPAPTTSSSALVNEHAVNESLYDHLCIDVLQRIFQFLPIPTQLSLRQLNRYTHHRILNPLHNPVLNEWFSNPPIDTQAKITEIMEAYQKLNQTIHNQSRAQFKLSTFPRTIYLTITLFSIAMAGGVLLAMIDAEETYQAGINYFFKHTINFLREVSAPAVMDACLTLPAFGIWLITLNISRLNGLSTEFNQSTWGYQRSLRYNTSANCPTQVATLDCHESIVHPSLHFIQKAAERDIETFRQYSDRALAEYDNNIFLVRNIVLIASLINVSCVGLMCLMTLLKRYQFVNHQLDDQNTTLPHAPLLLKYRSLKNFFNTREALRNQESALESYGREGELSNDEKPLLEEGHHFIKM